MLALISTLDAIDFNLFVKEEEISKADFTDDWVGLFAGNQLNFDRLTPPVRISLNLLRVGSMKSPSMGSLLSQGKANDDDLIMQRLAALNDENARLRRSLVAQINQRAYFQEEYRRAQTRCAVALLESHTFHEDNTVLQRRAKELASLIEVHERTNEALQEQLADAYNDDTGGKEQGRRMRDTINRLGAELETERMHHKALRSELDQRETSEATAIEQLKSQLAELRECETLWADRIKMLQEQLKLANSLKEEYKRRLKSSSPDPSE